MAFHSILRLSLVLLSLFIHSDFVISLSTITTAYPTSSALSPVARRSIGPIANHEDHAVSDEADRSYTPDYEPVHSNPIVLSPQYGGATVQQKCPATKPVACSNEDCLGSNTPPSAFRCTSTSISIINSIEFTLFDCQCCPDKQPQCEDELCQGNNASGVCLSDLLKGCWCEALGDNSPRMEGQDIFVLPDKSPSLTEEQLKDSVKFVLENVWEGKNTNVPGYNTFEAKYSQTADKLTKSIYIDGLTVTTLFVLGIGFRDISRN